MRIKSTFKCSLIIKETFRFREGFIKKQLGFNFIEGSF